MLLSLTQSKSSEPNESECCESCGSEDAEYGPCPYASDVHGDDTPVWLCSDCYNNRAADI